MSDVNKRGTLACAINAAREHSVGQILIDFAGYTCGDFVLVNDEHDEFIISQALTQREIKEREAAGSLIREICTIIGVPRSYVKIILNNDDIKHIKQSNKQFLDDKV